MLIPLLILRHHLELTLLLVIVDTFLLISIHATPPHHDLHFGSHLVEILSLRLQALNDLLLAMPLGLGLAFVA